VRIEACMLTMSALLTHPMADADLPADAALVRRAADGDSVAFESLYRRHVRRVHGVIWRLVGGVEARAEELTQEAFLRAWQALPSFRGDSAFATWLHRLAINVALMNLRSRAGGEAREVDDAVLDQHAGATCSNGLKLDLERAVATLPPRARAVLVLFDIEGLSHEEISAQLGMAVGSSKAQLHRARGLLRERLGGSA
jgi:RNA polymerase sigma factor (sigma-70 family)